MDDKERIDRELASMREVFEEMDDDRRHETDPAKNQKIRLLMWDLSQAIQKKQAERDALG